MKPKYGTAEDLVALMEHPRAGDAELVRKAYAFAFERHKGHKRLSGDPYFVHLYATAHALAELGMGARTIAAGLLHDSIEDVGVTREEINSEFGPEVLFLVDGVTKLGELKYRGAERHVESLRRLFVATSRDIRVLMIKLMDRRHNIETLEHVPLEKRQRIAAETLEIYAPLADRLGMGRLKRELEDLSFPHMMPEEYKKMQEIMRQRRTAREPLLEKVSVRLKQALVDQSIRSFRMASRVKGLYSLYTKLERKGGDIERIHDILAIRVIVPSVEDCYRVLGAVHSLWRPLPGKIKDYIAFEKPNGYRSIHTTVVTNEAGPVEIQIRTEDMHREAQFGIASHLSYKESHEGKLDRGEQKRNRLWFRQLIPTLLRTQPEVETSSRGVPPWVEALAQAHDVPVQNASDMFMKEIRDDFFSYRVFVFTPKGDVIDLPVDSSPIDFAYAIHSEIGDHVSGAKVNGKLVALGSKLKNGDIVEIESKKSAQPSKKWLEYARTTLARRHIQQTLVKQQKDGTPTL